jgi:hypothetical protein
MNSVEIIKGTLEHLSTSLNLSFIFAKQAEANLLADHTDFPVLVAYPVRFQTQVNPFGVSDTTYTLNIDILQKSNLADFDNKERFLAHSYCETKKRNLLFQMKHLRDSEGRLVFRSITNVFGSYIKNAYDANADGVRVELQVRLNKQYDETCPLPLNFSL